jgi:glycogen(starch) synthase
MRILFLSNAYPPYARGGYEQWCQEVATELAGRGHQLRILTSRPPDGADVGDDRGLTVYRLLHLEVEAGLPQTAIRLLRHRQRLEQENLDLTQGLVSGFQPDVVLVWGMWNVPRSVPALVEQLLSGRVAYYLCDYWPSLPSAYIQRWQEPSRRLLTQWPKRLIGSYFTHRLRKEPAIPLNLAYPICVSRAVRELLVEAGVSVQHARVIYGGTQVEQFASPASRKTRCENNSPLRLLYAGRLSVEKGVHTAMRAVQMAAEQFDSDIRLDIVGKGAPDYEAELRTIVQRHNLSRNISFREHVARCEMPAVLAQYDALVFPSEWEEPFARIVLEAMAAGLLVIGTTTGGTGEILVEDQTGLTFPPGDARILASQIDRLFHDAELGRRLASAGRQLVEKDFTFTGMVDRLEAALEKIRAKREARSASLNTLSRG